MVAADATTLGRGLRLLIALESDEALLGDGLGVVEIAKLIGRDKSQVSRGLKTLAELGLVDRDPHTLDYRLGWRVFGLAARAGDRRLLTIAPSLLRELVARLGETAHLSVLVGNEVLTVLSELSPNAVRASGWNGRRVPAHCTSAGRALLFDHDREALATLFGDTALTAPGPAAPRDLDELERRIAAARGAGYALTCDELEAGLVAAAAPIRDFRGRIVAALNISAPQFRFEGRLDAAGGHTRASADELSGRLGWFAARQPASSAPSDGRSAA